MARVLHRPAGGWGRNSAWRAEVALWLAWALMVVSAWGSLNGLAALFDVLAGIN